MACPRVQYRRRTHYATRSNRMKFVRTPGNRLVLQKRDKRVGGPHTPWVLGHKRLAGTIAQRPNKASHSDSSNRTVSRPYGGCLSHDLVRDRIVRAFLIEEQRIVKKVLQAEAKYQKEKKRRDRKNKKRQARVVAAKKKVGKSKVKAGAKKATKAKK